MMRKLFIAIGFFFAFSFYSKAQNATRAVGVHLDPNDKEVYDSLFYANDWRKNWITPTGRRINTDSLYGKDWLSKMLKVGDPMPDIEFGTTMNNPSSKKRFSDFNGKIVILDFWNTSCRTCIAGFPKMSELQKKFGDQIQIILVNTSETEEKIKSVNEGRIKSGRKPIALPDVLGIVGARHLIPYFPTTSVPLHVWIDQKGILRIIGSAGNTYDGKIIDLLNHRNISSFPTEATRPGIDPETPYYKLVKHPIDPNIYNSFFTSFNREYAPLGSGITRNKINSLDNTVRNTFINQMVSELYGLPVHKLLFKNIAEGIAYKSIVYEVHDSLRYDYKIYNGQIDTIRSNASFCYEQVYPKGISEEQSQKMMLEDLNTYFGKLYGTYGRIEKRSLPGFVIQKRPGQKHKQLLSESKERKELVFMKNGKKWNRYQCISFSDLFSGSIKDWLFANNKVLVNESGIKMDAQIDIELPVDATLSDIALALKPYGLEIKERNVELEQLVISDTKPKWTASK